MIPLKFKGAATFLGRNGEFKSTGLEVGSLSKEWIVQPITSRGVVGRCYISIPHEDLPDVIKMLQSLLPPSK